MNINDLLKYQKNNNDLKIRKLVNNKVDIYIIYFETLCNSESINDFILEPLSSFKIKNINDVINKIPSGNLVSIKNNDELYELLFNGFTIISINNKFISFETKYSLDSGITEATNEKVVKGPKDSFTENYQLNIGLIRKRIRSRHLSIKEYTIGTKSKTKVSLLYVDDIANKDLVNKIDKKMNDISLDYLANSNYIIECISNKNYLFPINQTTERPDLASISLMEGRIVIIVENTPQVIIVPIFFNDFIKSTDDYYQNTKNVSLTRIIRLLSFLISIMVPGFYIALTTFNQETLPTNLLINFTIQREGVPFPSIVEAIIMIIIFEILREADTRIPLVVGSSMSIVGALVVGEAAVSAGLISPIMIIIVAISSISSFLFNDNDFVNAIRIWKFIFIILSAITGLYGFFIALLLLLVNLSNTYSFNFDYTYPLSPFNFKEQFNNFILNKKYKFNKRNHIITSNTNRR